MKVRNKPAHYNLRIEDSKSLHTKRVITTTYLAMLSLDELETVLSYKRTPKCVVVEVLIKEVRKHLPASRDEIMRAMRFCLKQREFSKIWN